MWTRKHEHGSGSSTPTGLADGRSGYDSDRHLDSRSLAPDEIRPRSSSDSATPRQTPAPPSRLGFLSPSSSSSPGVDHLPTPSRSLFSSEPPNRKLGILTDKLQSLAGHHHHGHPKPNSLNPALLLHPHSRSSESPPISPAYLPPSPTMSSSNKVHTSPSKASYGRTYDSKLVTREMHRLGNLAHLPPALSQPPSVSLPPPEMSTSGDPWGTLHRHILPLFNGEPLRIPIEDLNVLVKRHITTAASSPSKAISNLDHDTTELIGSGMRTLNAKLAEKEDDKLIGRVVEIWGFFWDQVLPYVEGALLPLQTDPLLLSLFKQPKRPSSPTRQGTKGSISSISAFSAQNIDVRAVALRSFRDKVILPLAPRLKARLSLTNREDETPGYQQPRLQQMLLVLASQSRHRTPAFSLSSAPPQRGEAAVLDLLHTLRSPGIIDSRVNAKTNGRSAPSFVSGGLPGDRRGRIAQKNTGANLPTLTAVMNPPLEDDDLSGGETPRLGGTVLETRRGEAFIEALKSPDPLDPARTSVGGWGLGIGQELSSGKEDEEDEPLDWDQAQAVVERMVGMSAVSSEPTLSRRR